MFRVLIADDNFEDRELLKLEIERALKGEERGLKFFEAVSVRRARELLDARPVDLMTLDIEFDRLNEGIEELPEFFERYPTLNIIVISGKLDKGEVTDELFRFTKDNVLKGKRWARHFDVMDKKDDKTEAIRRAYAFAVKQSDTADKVRDLLLLAESHMERNDVNKCMDVFRKIQEMAPGERESGENIGIVKGASPEKALEYFRKGEVVVASLLLGHHIENRLKVFTRRAMGRNAPGLYDCLKDLERSRRISPYRKDLFQRLIRLRNKAVHHPSSISEHDFERVRENLKLMEADF